MFASEMEWQIHISKVTNTFSEQMCNILSQHQEKYSLGRIGITFICAAMALKMDILKQDKETVVAESLAYLESVVSKRNVTMLANVNKHINSFTYYENEEKEGTSEEAMNQIHRLAIRGSKTLKMLLLDPLPIDMGVVWFAFGIGMCIKGGVHGEQHSFDVLRDAIKTLPFDEMDRFH